MGSTIKIKRNDTRALTISIRNKGELIDTTGYTIFFTVRSAIPTTADSDDDDAVIEKTVAGNSTGIHSITLSSTDTNIDPDQYLYDIQYKKPDDSIHSSGTGQFIIEADITRSVGA